MSKIYSSGERDKKLNKKNVSWYCDRLLGYAHEGRNLDCFLRDHYIRRSKWDKYVKAHKDLQTALYDAKDRAKGAIMDRLINSANTTALTNPTLLKLIAENQLGWTKSSDVSTDAPPPVINFVRAPPLPHQLPGAGSPEEELQKYLVQETGDLAKTSKKKRKSNGGGNGSG